MHLSNNTSAASIDTEEKMGEKRLFHKDSAIQVLLLHLLFSIKSPQQVRCFLELSYETKPASSKLFGRENRNRNAEQLSQEKNVSASSETNTTVPTTTAAHQHHLYPLTSAEGHTYHDFHTFLCPQVIHMPDLLTDPNRS